MGCGAKKSIAVKKVMKSKYFVWGIDCYMLFKQLLCTFSQRPGEIIKRCSGYFAVDCILPVKIFLPLDICDIDQF